MLCLSYPRTWLQSRCSPQQSGVSKMWGGRRHAVSLGNASKNFEAAPILVTHYRCKATLGVDDLRPGHQNQMTMQLRSNKFVAEGWWTCASLVQSVVFCAGTPEPSEHRNLRAGRSAEAGRPQERRWHAPTRQGMHRSREEHRIFL